jgi:hypothetical protein
VIRCVGFDAPSDIAGNSSSNSGILPAVGTNGTTPQLDTTVKASGASSLMFTILSNSSADSSGSYFTNFSTDLMTRFGANSEFYIQWRQRFNSAFLSTVFQDGGGWKQAIIGSGDEPGGAHYFSCTALETVTQNTFQRGLPQMYNSCDGSTSHGAFFPFEEPFGGDFKLQNARPMPPGCLFSQGPAGRLQPPPAADCFLYYPNEWMTFQVKIKTGPRLADEWTNSVVTLWVAREGQASQPVINFSINLTAGDPALDQKFGKIWLLPYHTGKNPAQAHPTGFVWYDELIISSNQIADPAP